MSNPFLFPKYSTVSTGPQAVANFLKAFDINDIEENNTSPTDSMKSFLGHTSFESRQNRFQRLQSVHELRPTNTSAISSTTSQKIPGKLERFYRRLRANLFYMSKKEEVDGEEVDEEEVDEEGQLDETRLRISRRNTERTDRNAVESLAGESVSPMMGRRRSLVSDNPFSAGLSHRRGHNYSRPRSINGSIRQFSVASMIIPGIERISIRRDSMLRGRNLTRASLSRMELQQHIIESGEATVIVRHRSPILTSSSLNASPDQSGGEAIEETNEREELEGARSISEEGSSYSSGSYCSILKSPQSMYKNAGE